MVQWRSFDYFMERQKKTVSIMIPCYNEEKTIERCILSCLAQTVKLDQILVVNDSSTDRTPEILKQYKGKIHAIKTPKNTGNKSSAQEYGLQFITSDIVVTTDGDTILDKDFAKEIVKEFDDPKVAAAGGYVRSMKYNWLTRCRAVDYSIGQNLHKLAQSYLGFMFVIPGAAGAFRTEIFKNYLTFDHDTITEDLDFTYKLHKLGFKIAYNRKAIVLTQDPATLKSYINQMRRWFGGGWQNLVKHFSIVLKPRQSLELSLMYIEGLIFSGITLVMPILNLKVALFLLLPYFFITLVFSIYACIREKRADLLLTPFAYFIFMYINAYIFWEQFIKEVILKRKNLVWFKPERVEMPASV